MAGAGDEDRGTARSKDDTSEDALEDVTAPYPVGASATEEDDADGRSSADDDPIAAETTTWAEAQAPPVLIEEETVLVHTPVVESLSETGASSTELDATVVSARAAAASPVEETPTVVYAEDMPPLDSASPEVSEVSGASAVDHGLAPETALEPVSEESVEAEAEPIAELEVAEAAASMSSISDESATRVERASTDARGTIPPSSSLHPMLLERVEPSLGRGERLRLDAAHWHLRLGRAEQNEVRLYTASASREHAEIRGNEHGEWILTPGAGRSLLVDGEAISEPIVLEVGMNLVMGGDHLRCVTEGLGRSEMAAQTAVDGMLEENTGGGFAPIVPWLIGGVVVVGIALFTLVWFFA